jgi:UDP-glucose 4-epimerase
MRALITGGAGFIGSSLAERLVADGHEVVVLDDLSTGKRSNLSRVEGNACAFVEGSILDRALLAEVVTGCDVVFHLAAAVGVHNIVNDPLGSLRTNLHGTENVLDACAASATPPRVLVASTSEIYGKNVSDGLTEESDRIYGSPLKSRWSYAEAKSLDELVTHVYVKERGLQAVIIRPFNTVGPRQTGRYGMVLPRLAAQAVRNEPLTVYGDGEQSRCFCHVTDVLEGMLRLIDRPDAVGQAFNLGGPEEISIADLAARIVAIAGSESTITYVPYTEAYGEGYEDMRRRVPNTTKARDLVGFQATQSLDDIIRSVVEFQREQLVLEDAALVEAS